MNFFNLRTVAVLLGATGVVLAEDVSSIREVAKQTSSYLRANRYRNSPCYLWHGPSCPGNKFCRVSEGACNIAEEEADGFDLETSPPYIEGRCKKMPQISACIEGEDPEVCGCDGNTYACRETAYSFGVNVMHKGACEQPRRRGGRYIVNTGSDSERVLDIYQGSSAPGTNINLWHQTGNDNQKWIYHTDSGVIESVACPGMVLDIEGGTNSNCASESNIILWHDTGAKWQQWTYSPTGKITSKYCKNMVIDIFNGSDADGANIQLFDDNTSGNGWNQVWSFQY